MDSMETIVSASNRALFVRRLTRAIALMAMLAAVGLADDTDATGRRSAAAGVHRVAGAPPGANAAPADVDHLRVALALQNRRR